MVNDIDIIIRELERLIEDGRFRACFHCDYRKACYSVNGGKDDCLIIDEVARRLREWQKFKEAEANEREHKLQDGG